MSRIKTPKTNLNESLNRILGTTIAKPFVARLGDPSQNYKVNVEGTDKLGLVYIHRIGDNPDSAYTAENTIGITKLIPKTLVKVKPSENGRFEIIGLASENAEYLAGVNTNDQSPVSRSQILDGGLLPNDSNTVLAIGALYLVVNTPYNTTDKNTGNLIDGSTNDTSAGAITPPSSANRAKMVLIQENPTTNTLSYKQSANFLASFAFNLIASSGFLPSLDANNMLKGYVKLVHGMTIISRDNIFSLPDIYRLTDTGTFQAVLSGLSITSATVATDDKVLIQDASDSDNLKTVTAQSIADLGSGGGGGSPIKAWLSANVDSALTGTHTDTVASWASLYHDANYWNSGDPTEIVLYVTSKTYLLEVSVVCYPDANSDAAIELYIRRYNSSNTLQETINDAQSYIVADTGQNGGMPLQFPPVAISTYTAGDYLIVSFAEQVASMYLSSAYIKLHEF